jgi:hypothetical protein
MNSRDVDGESPRVANETADRLHDLVADESSALEDRPEYRLPRGEYDRVNRPQYRRLGLGLASLGGIAVVGGILFADVRQVLFVIGAAGLFGGLLTYYISFGRFLDATVGERIYEPAASNGSAIAEALDLEDERIYLPADDGSTAWLFVPHRSEWDLPDRPAVPHFTEGDNRGLVLESTGSSLFREFERILSGELPAEPVPVAAALADALVEGFELADGVDPSVDESGGRAVFAISNSALGPLDRFDHPIASSLATGLAIVLDRPIALEVIPENGDTDWLVTCQWEPDETK